MIVLKFLKFLFKYLIYQEDIPVSEKALLKRSLKPPLSSMVVKIAISAETYRIFTKKGILQYHTFLNNILLKVPTGGVCAFLGWGRVLNGPLSTTFVNISKMATSTGKTFHYALKKT